MTRSLKKRAVPLVIIISLMLLAGACAVTEKTLDTSDLSYIYNPSRNFLSPFIIVYNEDEERSVININIRKNELYFSEANPEGVPMASLLVSARLYNNTLGGGLADTATYRYDIKKEDAAPDYVIRLPLKTYDNSDYTAEVKIIDLIRQRTMQIFIDFDRNGPYSKLNYKIRNHFSHSELYSTIVRQDQYFNVLSPLLRPDTLWFFYYSPVKALPAAPTAILPEVTPTAEPDTIVAVPYSDTLALMLPAEGIYIISVDSLIREGLVLLNLGPDHPSMTQPETMIPPLAYIATPGEIDDMLNAEKPKLALDSFWLDRTGSIDRAKELIRIYYNRTLFSNYYFTSYKAGWLTDRGMIYTIYGPPDKVYKNAEGESWGYKLPKTKSRWGSRYTSETRYLWFNFRKQKSIFSDNDFVLNRAGTPVSYWDIAVARWREGKVFRLDNPEELQ